MRTFTYQSLFFSCKHVSYTCWFHHDLASLALVINFIFFSCKHLMLLSERVKWVLIISFTLISINKSFECTFQGIWTTSKFYNSTPSSRIIVIIFSLQHIEKFENIISYIEPRSCGCVIAWKWTFHVSSWLAAANLSPTMNDNVHMVYF